MANCRQRGTIETYSSLTVRALFVGGKAYLSLFERQIHNFVGYSKLPLHSEHRSVQALEEECISLFASLPCFSLLGELSRYYRSWKTLLIGQ